MATFDADTRVQVLIRRDTLQGRFQDALYLSRAEFDALTDRQIEARKDERVNGWLAAVAAAKVAPRVEPTRAELQERRVALEAELAEVNTRLAR